MRNVLCSKLTKEVMAKFLPIDMRYNIFLAGKNPKFDFRFIFFLILEVNKAFQQESPRDNFYKIHAYEKLLNPGSTEYERFTIFL
eukprot:snap_masked-scaffold_3-processed-gene-2.26-mRNA-1 protein AED:1.00 eAED:1.00 QI:0/0/0/0/1/1/2/0/84